MARDSPPSSKIHQANYRNISITSILLVIGLCSLSYILGAWQGSASAPGTSLSKITSPQCKPEKIASNANTLDFQAHHQVGLNESASKTETFFPCDLKYSEYTPCQDPRRARKFEKTMLKYRERHCPKREEFLRCLIPAPPNYKNPFGWPRSRDYAWYDNIPHKELSIEKAVQNWIQVEGKQFRFPGGGTMFPRGADAYIDDINKLVPLTDGSIRTALDTGCGVGSFLF
jgi:Putative S-adenosyl-L-methionine-dependent methyltransferase